MQRFHIEFIGRKWIWFSASSVVIVVGLIAVMLGGLKLGVEFQGGNQFDVRFKKAPAISDVRETLDKLKLGASTIQPVGSGNEYLIRTSRLSSETRIQVQTALKKDFDVKDISTRDIGPGWGKQVTDGAVKALIASFFILLIYISIRFEFKMAVATIVALFHDALIVVSVYSVIGLIEQKIGLAYIPTEVTPNTVAALLAILGFSMYDTIVVLHRIKENAGFIGKRTYSQMTNDSINQVLMRSVNTSMTELIPVFVLFAFGGETLKDFAFAMFVGLISGVYSSLFIACPVLAMWKETEPRYVMQREKYGALEGKPPAVKVSSPLGGEGKGEGDVTAEAPAEDSEITKPKPQLSAAQKAKKKKKKKKR
ncbi:MAG: protein translocase subunit SecF [Actinomycetota bacterium]